MSARKVALRIIDFVDYLPGAVCWFAAGLILAALTYLLAAPPVVLAHVKQTGSGSFPQVYWPALRLIESDFGGPIVWYFNQVWDAGLILIGSDKGPPWYVLAAYAVVSIGLLSVLTLPISKIFRKQRALQVTKTPRCI